MKKILALTMAMALSLTLFAGCGSKAPASSAAASGSGAANGEKTEPLKIALILPGAKDDVSFNQAMYEGMTEIEAEYGDAVEVSYVENVYDVADITPTVIDFAEEGYDLVFGHGFQFMEPIMELADQYPDTVFLTGTGYLTSDNAGYYNTHLASGGYVMGVIAATISETGKIGVIGGSNVAEIYQGHEGFKAGAKSVNPDIAIEEVYTGDFNDTPLAKTTADGMYDAGVDVIWHSGDGIGLGVVQSAKEKGKYCLTNAADQSSLAPESVVSGVVYDWKLAIREAIEDVKSGTFATGEKAYWCTVENGGINIAPYLEGAMTEEQTATVNKVVEDIRSGALEIPEYK